MFRFPVATAINGTGSGTRLRLPADQPPGLPPMPRGVPRSSSEPRGRADRANADPAADLGA
jgi:hypothetical protein